MPQLTQTPLLPGRRHFTTIKLKIECVFAVHPNAMLPPLRSLTNDNHQIRPLMHANSSNNFRKIRNSIWFELNTSVMVLLKTKNFSFPNETRCKPYTYFVSTTFKSVPFFVHTSLWMLNEIATILMEFVWKSIFHIKYTFKQFDFTANAR